MIRCLLPFLLLLFALSANAQETALISPIVSFDYGSPLFINRAAGAFNHSSIPDTGVSSSFSYGLGAEGAMGLIGSIGLIGRMEGIYSTGIFTGRDTVSGHEWKLLAEALAEWKPSAISLRAGPWVSERLLSTISSNVSAPSSASNPFHAGIAAGLSWAIPNFSLEPEIHTHLDFTELSQAGSNAWSIGLLLSYHLGENNRIEASALQASRPSSHAPHSSLVTAQPSSLPPRVQFLVNGSAGDGMVPLERVETRFKDYTMVDSANTPPKVTQWIEESYHLPRLAVGCKFPQRNETSLRLFKDSFWLFEKTFKETANAIGEVDTVLDLDRDSAWQHVLALMNTGENNRLIAELRTNSETARDTLILPPADTSRSLKTIVKQEFRFELSDNYSQYKGGRQSLNLLLGRMKELLDSTNTIRIWERTSGQNPAGHAALEKKLEGVLGNRERERSASGEMNQGFIVILER